MTLQSQKHNQYLLKRIAGLAKPLSIGSKGRRMSRPTGQRVAVIGTGYVGLTTGACLAALGHTVVCADVDQEKLSRLKRGIIPIHEDGLEQIVQDNLKSGRLTFVLGAANAVPNCDVVFMCLPTPQGVDGSADLSYLLGAAEEIGQHLKIGAIVVNKSTVPVGSAALVARKLGNPSVSVASNPEFLRQGTAVNDFFKPERIVIGAERDDVAKRVDRLYKRIKAPRVHVNTATAELLKYAANAFLATKISYANSISTVSESLGANAFDVLDGMGKDSRIGAQFLTPGPGWGGSCFPKDTHALLHSSRQANYEFSLLQAAIDANDAQSERIVAAVRRMAGGNLKGKKIAIWGLTFKAGTDDLRDSPAVRIIERLSEESAVIHAYDPAAKLAPKHIIRHATPLAVCQDADVLVVLTEWPQFRNIPLEDVASRLKYPKIVDARGILDINAAQDLGIQIWSVSHTAKRRYRPAPMFPLTGNIFQRTYLLARFLPGRIVQKLPDHIYARAMFLRRKGTVLRLKNPKTYSAKINWLKIYGGLENYTNYVDKYQVRAFVEQTIGKQYLTPLLGVWDKFDDIPFDDLPKKFILKATHGPNYMFECSDKSKIDMRSLKIQVDSWMNENFYQVEREPQYKHIQRKLICEPLVREDAADRIDFKIPCFGRKPHFVQVLTGDTANKTEDFYGYDWTRLNIQERGYSNSQYPTPKPRQLAKMLELAQQLSRPFPFVRVDFYIAVGKIYFSELSFTPASGIITYESADTDLELGQLLDLSSLATAAS
jgi:UDPglucose 6-dehydrogenase